MKSRPYMTFDGDVVNIVNICDWLDEMGFDWQVSYEDTCKALKEYREQNPGIAYYAAPREDFSLHRAAEKALAEKCHTVIVEDLS